MLVGPIESLGQESLGSVAEERALESPAPKLQSSSDNGSSGCLFEWDYAAEDYEAEEAAAAIGRL